MHISLINSENSHQKVYEGSDGVDVFPSIGLGGIQELQEFQKAVDIYKKEYKHFLHRVWRF